MCATQLWPALGRDSCPQLELRRAPAGPACPRAPRSRSARSQSYLLSKTDLALVRPCPRTQVDSPFSEPQSAHHGRLEAQTALPAAGCRLKDVVRWPVSSFASGGQGTAFSAQGRGGRKLCADSSRLWCRVAPSVSTAWLEREKLVSTRWACDGAGWSVRVAQWLTDGGRRPRRSGSRSSSASASQPKLQGRRR